MIQINGKKRNLISVESNITEKQLLIEIDKSKLIEKYVKNKEVKKVIYVKNRLVNYIIL